MFSHLHSTPVAVKIFDHVLGKFRDLETADRLRSVYFTFSLEIQYTGRDFFSFLFFFFSRSAPPPRNKKNFTHRNARKARVYRDNVTMAWGKKIFDCHFRLRKTISTTRNTLPSKIFDRRQRVKLESRYAIDARFRRKHRGQYLIEFRNSVYVPGVPSALCKPTFSFLELKQRGRPDARQECKPRSSWKWLGMGY